MIFSIILAHPRKNSFNHAIAHAAEEVLLAEGVKVFFHDLYEENFPPVLPDGEEKRDVKLPSIIGQHCEEIKSVDGIIVVHPNWWGQPPAILTGWIDRVFRPGVTYRFIEGDQGEGIPQGLLKAHIAMVFNTANTSAKREMQLFKDPLQTLWQNCIFGLCGVDNFVRKMFTIMVTSTPQQREEWLLEVKDLTKKAIQDVKSHKHLYHTPDHSSNEL